MYYFLLLTDFADPFVLPGGTASSSSSESFQPNEESLMMIMSMGFTKEQATKALKNTVSKHI